MWRPVPDALKISSPCRGPIFTSHCIPRVITEDGHQFEVQIRTEEMPRWRKKALRALEIQRWQSGQRQDEQRLAWLRQVVRGQQDVKDPSEFLSTLKVDLLSRKIYCFTPHGRW